MSDRSMIEFGDWAIGSNMYGWNILFKTTVKGQTQWQSKFYYSTFADCVDALIKKKVRISDYSTVKELAENFRTIRDQVYEVIEKNGMSTDV